MSEFTIRSESVDVEQIMKQIRARILEKRGADYTEDQIRELASVRLEKFLEPRNLRSDLLEQFRKSRPAVNTEPPTIEAPYTFDDQTLFASHRGLMRFARKLFRPLLNSWSGSVRFASWNEQLVQFLTRYLFIVIALVFFASSEKPSSIGMPHWQIYAFFLTYSVINAFNMFLRFFIF